MNDARIVWLPVLFILIPLNRLPSVLNRSVGHRILPLVVRLLLNIVRPLAAVATGVGVSLGKHYLKLGSGFLSLHEAPLEGVLF